MWVTSVNRESCPVPSCGQLILVSARFLRLSGALLGDVIQVQLVYPGLFVVVLVYGGRVRLLLFGAVRGF